MNTFLGILAALGTAAAKSATDISTKAASSRMSVPALMAVAWSIAAAILVLVLIVRYPLLVVEPGKMFPELIKPGFWWILAIDGLLNAIAAYFYTRAFQLSDASLVAPIMLLTPVFMLVTSPVLLGEHVTLAGAAGIVFAVAGGWLLGRNGSSSSAQGDMAADNGLLAPFRVLAGDRGVQSMLVTVMMWSVSANLDKMGVLASTPLTWGASLTAVVAACSLILWIATRRAGERGRPTWSAAAVGCGLAAQAFMQNIALTLLLAPYVIALKRTSTVMTVLASGILFREATANRLAGTLIMLIGTVLMIFASYTL